VTLDENALQV